MDINEVKERKKLLEKTIHELINEFTKDTECYVTNISVNPVFEYNYKQKGHKLLCYNSTEIEVKV